MTGTRSSYDRSTRICMLGLVLAGAALMGCDAEVAETASLSQPVQVVYTPCQDTWMRRTAGGPVDWGLSHELRTNNVDVAGYPEAIFLHFCVDLPTVCPTLANATLSLQSAQLTGPLWVQAHRITSGWMPGNTGAAPEQDWAVSSSDSAPFAPPMFLLPAAVSLVNEHCTRFTWDVTPIVQAWCAGAPNLGIRLDGHNHTDANLEVNFFSMESLSPARRPTLEISY